MESVIKRLLAVKSIRYMIVILLALLASVSVVQGVRNALDTSQDFQWDAARALIDGEDPYDISLEEEQVISDENLKEFYSLFTDKGLKQKMEANQFPSLLYLLLPYALMKPFAARIAWIISNLVFTAGIIILLRKTFLKGLSPFGFAVCTLLMLSGTPYRNQLGVGQHTLFSFCFFMLAVWLNENKPSGNRLWIALCMFISYFKYTLTAPLTLYLLYKKRFREFAVSIAGHIALTLFAAARLKESPVDMIVKPLKVASVLSSEGGIDLGVLLGGGKLYLLAAGIAAIGITVIALKMPKEKEYILFPLLIMWSLILTYHRTYDFFVLSAIPVLFTGLKDEDLFAGERTKALLTGWYVLLLLLVYFGLRIFDENTMSKIVTGAVYYGYTAVLTFMAVRSLLCSKGRKEIPQNP